MSLVFPKKVICAMAKPASSVPILYDMPLSSMQKSGQNTPIGESENLKVGVNLGVLFGSDINRSALNSDFSKSILGYFVALKFHNHNLFS